jgi:hypothetical protein
MAYTPLCTVEEILAYYPGIGSFNSSSTPKKTDVEAWISRATSVVYAFLATMYTVPVDDTVDDYVYLKGLCIDYVKDEINFVLGKNRVGMVQNGVLLPRQSMHTGFYTQLENIRTGKMRLPSLTSSELFSSYNADNSVVAESNKEGVLW